ncbi:MAG: DUF308 domain-containing protein [Woeseiaceae bacterium]|nr:DUF308 domain-containing protein [Woeseiaceae bacterium]
MNEVSDVARLPARVGTGWGFAVMVLGVLCIMAPFVSGLAVNLTVAVAVLAAGMVMTTYAFKAGSFGKGFFQFLFGGITIFAGAVMLAQPVVSLFALTVVLIAWFLVDGIFSIIQGVSSKGVPGRGWVIVSGVASVILAVLLYRQWPDSGKYAIGLLAGIRLIFSGWSMAMLGMMSDASVDVVEQAVDTAVDEVIAGSGSGGASRGEQ